MLIVLLASYLWSIASACTAVVVEKAGSADGSMLSAHTNDCKQCDFRMMYIPRADHAHGSRREIVALRPEYPRYVGDDRGPAYRRDRLEEGIYDWEDTPSIASIPQVPHTYAYIDSAFPIINEHQVAMGESTCSGKLYSAPVFAGGHALVDMTELTRIALERCKTARCAIKEMGRVAEELGYYGEDWSGSLPFQFAEAGEGMTVADKEEAWVFHILPDDTGKGAVWAAQRVPKGHIAVIANEFIIKDIDFDDADNFIFSSNVQEVAERNGFWPKGKTPFNFQRAYNYAPDEKHYSQRRIWRLFTMANPSLDLNPNATIYELPFSVPVGELLTWEDVASMNRDHYEGTAFDMTKGMAAGPFGNPNRYDGGDGAGTTKAIRDLGYFPRAVSIFRTSYSYVAQSRSEFPDLVGAKVWLGPYAPAASAYVPFYLQGPLHSSYERGTLSRYDPNVAWWAHSVVGNWADKMYKYIMEDVNKLQQAWEKRGMQVTHRLEVEVMQELQQGGSTAKVAAKLSAVTKHHADQVQEQWRGFFNYVITKWHDNYRVDDLHADKVNPQAYFYPQWWLEQVGYFNASTLKMLHQSGGSAQSAVAGLGAVASPSSSSSLSGVMSYLLTAIFFFAAGAGVALQLGARRGHGYDKL